jgi:type VI secretion system protein ImpM
MSETIELPDELPDASAGFFGKVTSNGDFVSRRLPASFKQPWDEWLQHGMQGSRSALGDAWLDTYLSSPIWRFALAPGVCDANSWAGILMPSVDRVGRHFPLTIAAGVEGDVALLDWVENAASWYDRLEELALESLREDFSLDALDAALLQTAPPSQAANSVQNRSPGIRLPIAGLASLPDAMPGIIRQIAGAALAGHGLWWTEGSTQVEPSLLMCKGLPAHLSVTAMLDGQWAQGGWQPGN